jgi:hypothetical protein
MEVYLLGSGDEITPLAVGFRELRRTCFSKTEVIYSGEDSGYLYRP